MKIAIITGHDAPYQELANITMPSLVQYATKHQYTLYYQPDIPAIEKDACKARIFRELYESGEYGPDDLCMWIDTDAMVMNQDIKVEDVWVKHADESTHFLWAYDFNGPNSGVWIARFSGQAENFIRVYLYEQFAMGWGDNNPMNQKMNLPPFKNFVKCISGIYMNAYPYEEYGLQDMPHKREVNAYEPGDWILHGAGMESKRRMEVLRSYAGIIASPNVVEEPKAWPVQRGVEKAKDLPRGLHDVEDWAVWHAVFENNEYGITEFRPDDVVIDIGMHIGSFTCLAYMRGSRHILSYEVDSGSFAIAQQNVAGLHSPNGDVQIFNKAVVGVNDKPIYYVPGSMLTNYDKGERAESIAFDDILTPLRHVRYLKIDCEGGEWDILYGSTQLHKIQEIGGEYHPLANKTGADPDTLEKFLQKAGFQTQFTVKPGIGDFRAWR